MIKIDYKSISWLAPGAAWYLVFLVVPVVFLGIVSVLTRGTFGGFGLPATMSNYQALVSPLYLGVFIESFANALSTMAVTLAIGYPAALCLSVVSPKAKSSLLLLLLVPYFTGSLVKAYAWLFLLGRNGPINQLLLGTGIIESSLQLLFSDLAVIFTLAHSLLPFGVLPIYFALTRIPDTVKEAASDLGATPWQTFSRVTLPLSAPGIAGAALLVFVTSLGAYIVPQIIGGSQSHTIGTLIARQYLQARNWPLGAASTIVLLVLAFPLLWLYLRFINRMPGQAE